MKRLQDNGAAKAREAGLLAVRSHPVLFPLADEARFLPDNQQRFVGSNAWLAVTDHGVIWVNAKRKAEADTWTRLAAIALLCLGFDTVREREPTEVWEIAALLIANRFCDELKVGRLPADLMAPEIDIPAGGVEGLFHKLVADGCDSALLEWHCVLTGGKQFFQNLNRATPVPLRIPRWKNLLAAGISRGVGQALEVASGSTEMRAASKSPTKASRARRRLMDFFPLLGALAASFDIEEDIRVCQQYDIRVAAIDVSAKRIWMNPAANLSEDECLFVFAHELLHAGLNHASRRRGRDPLLWNIACDFVINGWLLEMRVGVAPSIGLLHDEQFAGQSAEDVYDFLARDIRRARKLATLRGAGAVDLLGEDEGKLFTDAEAYCKRALAQGLERHTSCGTRGLVPAGLIEEIRSVGQPPIPWDVRLAEWFDERFPPPEARRSYARPSRRQASTPDIPRPSVVKPSEEERHSRVFGVVLDTSGSMEPQLLGKALGAIASYALARDVAAVRLVCCDAQAYDSGWVEPERLLDRFSLHGRGGTVLQPGLDCLHTLAGRGEFPRAGPLLVITDGYCEDDLATSMDHAFLLPEGRRLPFRPRGQVFHVG